MAMIARNFEIELDEAGGPVTERLSFTLIPRGLRIRLRERTRQKPIVGSAARVELAPTGYGYAAGMQDSALWRTVA